jgi:hypothetical protein
MSVPWLVKERLFQSLAFIAIALLIGRLLWTLLGLLLHF